MTWAAGGFGGLGPGGGGAAGNGGGAGPGAWNALAANLGVAGAFPLDTGGVGSEPVGCAVEVDWVVLRTELVCKDDGPAGVFGWLDGVPGWLDGLDGVLSFWIAEVTVVSVLWSISSTRAVSSSVGEFGEECSADEVAELLK